MLIDDIEKATEPSEKLFREIFDIVFPEPPKEKFLSWRWWFPSKERSEWNHADFHFYRLVGRKKWNTLILWLLAKPESYSLTILRNSLNIEEPNT